MAPNVDDIYSYDHISIHDSSSMEHIQVKEVDVWNVVQDSDDDTENDSTGKPWTEKSTKGKVLYVLVLILKVLTVLTALYFFICSLSLLSSAFQLLGGKSAGEMFAKSKILNNPLIGLMIGVLVTVLVQSSSTSTSIIVAMVSAGIVELVPAINMVMGANIGTTVTNTIVSLGQSMDRKMFRRAFAGATVHDCFNWLCVLVFLPLEAVARPLQLISTYLTSSIGDDETVSELDFLKVITKPLTKRVISIDKNTIKGIAKYCTMSSKHFNDYTCEVARNASMMKSNCDDDETEIYERCDFLFAKAGLNDTTSGVILLIVSLLLLCTCLTILVKTLQSLLLGGMARTLKRHINSDLPYPFGWLTGYLFILIGVGMTILVQSSSVFTSAITPLVGMGVISLDRMFPLTLGSNIGTTGTSVLAALAATGDKRKTTIQVAICHLLFNIFGIAVFYPIPFMRSIPIRCAKHLGNTTAKYRWFAVVYLVLMFLLVPMVFIALSFNLALLYTVLGVALAVATLVLLLNILQKHANHRLPAALQTWHFLPAVLRSLEPYDTLFSKLICWSQKREKEEYNDIELFKTGKP